MEEKIDLKLRELELIQKEFISECELFLKSKIDEFTKLSIKSNLKKVENLGKKGLLKMKKQIDELNIKDLVNTYINKDDLWLFRQKEITSYNCEFGKYFMDENINKIPDIIEDSVRLLFSPIGKILMDFGLIDTDMKKFQDWKISGERVRYRWGFECSKGMKETMIKLNKSFKELHYLLKERESFKMDIEGDKALNLWEEVCKNS